MFQDDPAWVEHQRKRWMRPDAHLWIRPDAHRFMPPGAPRLYGKDAVRYFWPDHAPEQQAAERTPSLDVAMEREELIQLRSELDALKAEIKFRQLLRDSKAYNPNQPRVPAGNPDGGRWAGGSSAQERRIQFAGPLPKNDPPDIPKDRPPTVQERNRVARRVARSPGLIGLLGEAAPWLREHFDAIEAYNDPPKSLEELQQAVSVPKSGYDIHHIVEQGPARGKFAESMIDGPDNLVRIPRYKHWELNAWYGTKNPSFGDISPRDYLRDKEWDEHVRIGQKALIDAGVLRP